MLFEAYGAILLTSLATALVLLFIPIINSSVNRVKASENLSSAIAVMRCQGEAFLAGGAVLNEELICAGDSVKCGDHSMYFEGGVLYRTEKDNSFSLALDGVESVAFSNLENVLFCRMTVDGKEITVAVSTNVGRSLAEDEY